MTPEDCRFQKVTSLTGGSRQLCGFMLKISYTLYLTHWPFASILHACGVFDEDSWNGMAGTWAGSVVFAIGPSAEATIASNQTRSVASYEAGMYVGAHKGTQEIMLQCSRSLPRICDGQKFLEQAASKWGPGGGRGGHGVDTCAAG